MDRNNETIRRLAKKAADAWRSTDTYHQAAQIIDMLISALEGDPTLTPPNEPLTLEELREMDGEPVWCKWLLPEDRAIEQGKWFIVISGDKAGLEIKRPAEYGCHFCKIDDYGKTWLAYRRPPEGEEDT